MAESKTDLGHMRAIRRAVDALNDAVGEATRDGLHVDVDVDTLSAMEVHDERVVQQSWPLVRATVARPIKEPPAGFPGWDVVPLSYEEPPGRDA